MKLGVIHRYEDMNKLLLQEKKIKMYLNNGFIKIQIKMCSRFKIDVCHDSAAEERSLVLLSTHAQLKLPRL